MRQRRELGYNERFDDLKHILYEFHNYEVKSSLNQRLTGLIVANMIATLLTNPLDVVISKILTQNPQVHLADPKASTI